MKRRGGGKGHELDGKKSWKCSMQRDAFVSGVISVPVLGLGNNFNKHPFSS